MLHFISVPWRIPGSEFVFFYHQSIWCQWKPLAVPSPTSLISVAGVELGTLGGYQSAWIDPIALLHKLLFPSLLVGRPHAVPVCSCGNFLVLPRTGVSALCSHFSLHERSVSQVLLLHVECLSTYADVLELLCFGYISVSGVAGQLHEQSRF